MKYPCGICNKNVTENTNSIFCNCCNLWVHLKCTDLDKLSFKRLSEQDEEWYCRKCLDTIFPFSSLSNNEFLSVIYNVSDTYLDLYENCQILNVTNFPDEINLEENQLDINYRVSALDTGSIYVTSDQFNKKYNVDNEQNKFSIIHINCRSLNANFGEINNLLLDMNFKFDIIAMTETWFNSKTDYDLYQIDGYKMFVCNREFQQGGGVIIYVLDSYSCKKLDNLSYEREDLFEVVTVEILSHRNKSVNIGCMYRKPSFLSWDVFNSKGVLLPT